MKCFMVCSNKSKHLPWLGPIAYMPLVRVLDGTPRQTPMIRVYHRIIAWIWHREACARLGNRPFESVMHAVRAYGYHKVRAASVSRFLRLT